jgi:hypothetical protein
MELADYILSMFLFLICIHCIYLYYFLSIVLNDNLLSNSMSDMNIENTTNNTLLIIISNITFNKY